MCFVVTCWERADLLALVCGVYYEFVTFPLVSWVRCGTWLYRFLIFSPLLTLSLSHWYPGSLYRFLIFVPLLTLKGWGWRYETYLNHPVKYLLTVPRWYFFCRSFVLFMSCVWHAFMSVHCCLVVTCWERVDLLALVCDVSLCFCHFPMWYPGSGVVLELYRFLIFAASLTLMSQR